MGVGLTAATTNFMGDSYTFIDCPGSVEFAQEMRAASPAVDAAVVVCEADERKLPQLQIILRELEDLGIPRFLFLNKIDRANKRIRETLATLQPASRVPLVLRQIPIWNGELIEGFVELAVELAFVYREHKASEVIALEGGNLDREKEARFSMLEKLADHDDALMEQLLEDIQPPRDAVFDDLARELREGLICPVLLGAASRENGVLRLMKALRHEAPGVAGAGPCRADAAGAGAVARGDRPQGRRQARPGAAAAQRGRSIADDDPEPADPRHRAVGAGRDASARRARTAQGPFWRQRQIATARDRLSGDHPQIGHPARPSQEAVRRPWPVRRRGAGDQADAARKRLRVPREGGRRRGAAQLYRRGRGGRGRQPRAGPARLPGHRSSRHADGRLLSQRRFLRSRLPHRGADRHG